MTAVAIITARGGSRRIPGKNIREFCGKPIIAYSIEAAIKSGLFEEVMVSTDSEEIAETARNYGASIPFMRSEQTSNDYATTDDVVLETVTRYQEMGIVYDYVCCIYPTAPLISVKRLREAFRLLEENREADSVLPVVRFSFPPQRGMIIRSGYVDYQWPENAMKRSQDLETIYHDCGSFYLCRTASLMKNKEIQGKKAIPMELPEEEVQDIDNLSDWRIAEMKYRILNERG